MWLKNGNVKQQYSPAFPLFTPCDYFFVYNSSAAATARAAMGYHPLF